MPEKVHAEEQIIAALKQQESGEKTVDICCKLAISHAKFYLWKKQYAGLRVQELREMRQLREENSRLEAIDCRPLAGPADPAGDGLKKAVKPGQRCRFSEVGKRGIPDTERRAARPLRMAWSTMRRDLVRT